MLLIQTHRIWLFNLYPWDTHTEPFFKVKMKKNPFPMTKPVLTWSFRILNCVSKGPHWSFTGLAAGWPLNKNCFSDYSSITRWRGLWRRLQKLGLQSISGWWHLTRTILSSCLEDSDTKQFHLLLKFHQQGMHKASGSLNKTPGNARVRQGEIPLVWEKPQLGLRKASAWSSFCDQGFLHDSLCYLWLSQSAFLRYSKHMAQRKRVWLSLLLTRFTHSWR